MIEDKDFEERLERRRRAALAANAHRTFECIACGQRYTYAWVYEHGTWCDVECDGRLREVKDANHDAR
jgi:hypothetical protein